MEKVNNAEAIAARVAREKLPTKIVTSTMHFTSGGRLSHMHFQILP